jgi:hypothetical protein
MENWDLKEFSSFASWREESDLIDEVDFKEFFEGREK